MNDDVSLQNESVDSLELLATTVADEFMECVQRGERPSIEEYAERHPQIADMLREILPALQVMRSESGIDGSAAATSFSLDQMGTLGDFRIVREIGRGGMGVVYEAVQISLNRQVALKVLPFAAALDSRRLERFKHEAEAAAQLHHSNIVPVYSVGCERGVYYYAMQSIQGQSLAEVIGELRQLNRIEPEDSGHSSVAPLSQTAHLVASFADASQAKGQESQPEPVSAAPISGFAAKSSAETMSQAYASVSTEHSTKAPSFIRSMVDLVVQAAKAIEYAHGVGIIHRDIKPANLLVDTRGNLWVTDFGLARFRTSNSLTMSGDLLGTLRYMSPEQALGKRGIVDHRADVYSLGVTLYELLTLEPALNGKNREDLLRQIAFEEPLPPRRLNSAIPTDLETVILKAIAKEPLDRYLSAQDFADDLQRYLEHRPVLAKRPSLLERAAKWSRRHKPVVVSAIVLLLLSVIGLGFSTVWVAKQQAETEAAYEAEAQQRELAEKNFQQAREMLDFFVRFSDVELAVHPDTEELRRRLLEEGLKYYQNFIDQSRNDSPLRDELLESHVRVAEILKEIGSEPDAFSAFERAYAFQEHLIANHPQISQRSLYSLFRELVLEPGQERLVDVRSPITQDDLQLTGEQRKRINVLDMEVKLTNDRDEFDKFKKLSREERRLEFERHAQQTNAHIARILTPEQLQRLDQISIQVKGTRAFNDPEISAALDMTNAQIEQARAIRDEAHRSSRSREYQVDWSEVNLRILNTVLSPQQRQEWKKLTGKLFDRSAYWDFRFRRGKYRRSGSSRKSSTT